MQKINVLAVQINEHLPVIADMMRQLQENEVLLWDKSAQWEDIEKDYLQYMVEMQEECEGLMLIAFGNHEPAGFIFGYLQEEDESRCEISTGRILYVSDGFVYPQYRKRGVYALLNEQLENHYKNKGIKRMTRFTHARNQPMQQFLKKEGYEVTRLLYEKWL